MYLCTFLGSENSYRAKIHGTLVTASSQFMRERAMDVYMEN
jgi:hypothetical protein